MSNSSKSTSFPELVEGRASLPTARPTDAGASFGTGGVGPSSASGVLLPGFIGTTLPGWLATRLRGGLAGVCLFGDNIDTLPQLKQLTAAILDANPLAVIAIDEEGGDVTRLFYDVGSPYPGNAILGRMDDLAYTEAIATDVGRQVQTPVDDLVASLQKVQSDIRAQG